MSSTPAASPDSAASPSKPGLPIVAKIVLWIAALIVLMIVALYGIGMATPADHLATKSLDLKADKQAVYDTLVDWEHYPEWRPQLASVTAVPDPEGDPHWREEWEADQPVELEITAQEPGRRVEVTIHDPSGMFSGTWEFILAPSDDGAMVTLTERGTIHNPMARGMLACMPGSKEAYLVMYLEHLAGKFGEEPRIH
jgi:uncharacterized protein YndB with AHSA1/START domain